MTVREKVVIGVMFLAALIVPSAISGWLDARQESDICNTLRENRAALEVALKVEHEQLGEEFMADEATVRRVDREVRAAIEAELTPIDC